MTMTSRHFLLALHQSPGYFDHVLEVIVIIFKTYFENNQNILKHIKFEYGISTHQIINHNYFIIFKFFFYLFLIFV
jgi:hypothetical protein